MSTSSGVPIIEGKELNIELEKGLFIIRYQSAEDEHDLPQVRVVCSPPHNSVVFHPDRSDPILRAPGCAVVVRALRGSSVMLRVTPSTANGSVGAEFAVEEIDNP